MSEYAWQARKLTFSLIGCDITWFRFRIFARFGQRGTQICHQALASSTPNPMGDRPENRVPVEIWEQILLEFISVESTLVFATSCSPSNYLAFKRSCGDGKGNGFRYEYVKFCQSRRTLRAVCRTWKAFFDRLDHNDRWVDSSSFRKHFDVSRCNEATRLDFRENCGSRLTLLLSDWKLMGANGQKNTHLTRMEILNTDPEYFYRLFRNLCHVACVLRNLRSLALTIADEKYTIMEKLSQHFPELTHLTLCLHSREHRARSDDPEFEVRGSSMPEKLEVLFLFPGKRAFQLSHWNLPSLRHFHINPINYFAADTCAFLVRHTKTIETLDLDIPENGTRHYEPIQSVFNLDFWERFTNLRLLRCGWKVQLEFPRQRHRVECFVLTEPVDHAYQMSNVLHSWVKEGNIDALERIVLHGYFLTKQYHMCKDGDLLELIEELRGHGIRLLNPAGKSWI